MTAREAAATAPGQAAYETPLEALGWVLGELIADVEHVIASGNAGYIDRDMLDNYRQRAEAIGAAAAAQPAPGDVELRIARRTADELRAELTELREQLAVWPTCPDGCGCRLGTEDADARDCACDGPCCIECREMGYPDAPSYRDLPRAGQPAPEVASMPCEALAADNQKLREQLAATKTVLQETSRESSLRGAEADRLSARIAELSEALTEAAGHVEPVDQNSELAIGHWLELAKRTREAQPAPGLLPPRRPGAVYTPDGKYELPQPEQPAPGVTVTPPVPATLRHALTERDRYRQALEQIARNDGYDLARDHNAKIAKQALEDQ